MTTLISSADAYKVFTIDIYYEGQHWKQSKLKNHLHGSISPNGSLLVYIVLLKSYLRNPHQRNRVFLRCANKYFLRPDFSFTTDVLGILECKKTFPSARRWNLGIEADRDKWRDCVCSSLTRENYIWSPTNQRQQRQRRTLYYCVVLGMNWACKGRTSDINSNSESFSPVHTHLQMA